MNSNEREICAQCEANARHNEAGGYKELAEECRAYCRRGHVEAAANSVKNDEGEEKTREFHYE